MESESADDMMFDRLYVCVLPMLTLLTLAELLQI